MPACSSGCAQRGIGRASLTLHVGAGTFQPVRTENLDAHRMHREWFEIPQATVDAIARTRAGGGRVVAIGTTTLRALEAAADGAASGLRAGARRDGDLHHARLSRSGSSTCWSPISTCRRAR